MNDQIETTKKVTRWQWIIQCDNVCDDDELPKLTNRFYKDEEECQAAILSDYKIIGKAEWTKTEFDK